MVRTYRTQSGLTQEELAWRADLHRTYLADIERGARNITLRIIAKLAKALQVPVCDLLPRVVAGTESRGDGADASPAREVRNILLIHGNPKQAVVTARAFERAMHANPITIVRDGETALDYLFGSGTYAGRKLARPQLILLNIILPKMSPSEFLRRVKGDKRTSGIPVVILAASQ